MVPLYRTHIDLQIEMVMPECWGVNQQREYAAVLQRRFEGTPIVKFSLVWPKSRSLFMKVELNSGEVLEYCIAKGPARKIAREALDLIDRHKSKRGEVSIGGVPITQIGNIQHHDYTPFIDPVQSYRLDPIGQALTAAKAGEPVQVQMQPAPKHFKLTENFTVSYGGAEYTVPVTTGESVHEVCDRLDEEMHKTMGITINRTNDTLLAVKNACLQIGIELKS